MNLANTNSLSLTGVVLKIPRVFRDKHEKHSQYMRSPLSDCINEILRVRYFVEFYFITNFKFHRCYRMFSGRREETLIFLRNHFLANKESRMLLKLLFCENLCKSLCNKGIYICIFHVIFVCILQSLKITFANMERYD